MITLEKQPSASPAPASLEHTLAHYPFPPGFAQRLKKENRWTERQVTLVLTEYRRFLILAMHARVTPSQVVDRAWHLHLTYTRDYWERLMPLLPTPLHHDPAGDGEQAGVARQYLDTLDLYQAHFGVRPHPGIWPDPRRPVKRAAWKAALFLLVPFVIFAALLFGSGSAHLTPWLWTLGVGGLVLYMGWRRSGKGRRPNGRDRAGNDTSATGAAASFVLISELDGFSGSDSDSGGSDGGGGDSGGSSCGGGGCGGGCGSD